MQLFRPFEARLRSKVDVTYVNIHVSICICSTLFLTINGRGGSWSLTSADGLIAPSLEPAAVRPALLRRPWPKKSLAQRARPVAGRGEIREFTRPWRHTRQLRIPSPRTRGEGDGRRRALLHSRRQDVRMPQRGEAGSRPLETTVRIRGRHIKSPFAAEFYNWYGVPVMPRPQPAPRFSRAPGAPPIPRPFFASAAFPPRASTN